MAAGHDRRRTPYLLLALVAVTLAARVDAQSAATTRLDILLAEARGAKSTRDQRVLRNGLRHRDGETVRMAVRALGRLERLSVINEIALTGTDQLGGCRQSPDAIAALERIVRDVSDIDTPRGWHRNAHALVALAVAAPDRVADAMASHAGSRIWQVRMYAARAAATAVDRRFLDMLAADADDRVANVALSALGFPTRSKPVEPLATDDPTVAELRRLASPRAVVTIRDVGRVELALFTAEAPTTVLRFAQLAESGYYDGLAFDDVTPNLTAQGGRNAAGHSRYPHLEVGMWPHVRGAAGIATPESGDAQFFVNLVDNPQYDHRYTVFAQVLNGADRVDSILEGDVIESIRIVP